ncbi:hypothetical protein TNCV_743011 [Trichonephila clavipes]|nr:hypothetical protein TNCV_743011 [Trichonephila clavipes]
MPAEHSPKLDTSTIPLHSATPYKGQRDLAWFHPNFEGERPRGDEGTTTFLPLPPTSREDLRVDGCLEYPPCRQGTIRLQIAMSSPGLEPNANGTTVSVTNHYTGWATKEALLIHKIMKRALIDQK